MTKNSAESLTLHVIDGMLAYEAIKANSRNLRPRHLQDSFVWRQSWAETLIPRVFSLVKAAQKMGLYGGYRLWPWYLTLAYGNKQELQKIYCVSHFGLETTTPFLPPAVAATAVREQVERLAAGTPWVTTFSFLGNVDAEWLKTGGIPSISVFDGTFEDSPLYQGYEVLLEITDSMLPDTDAKGEKFLKSLYKKYPEAIACMYLYRMFPDEVRAWANIKTSAVGSRLFLLELTQDYVYTMLQLGFPALHRSFGLDYPTQEVVIND